MPSTVYRLPSTIFSPFMVHRLFVFVLLSGQKNQNPSKSQIRPTSSPDHRILKPTHLENLLRIFNHVLWLIVLLLLIGQSALFSQERMKLNLQDAIALVQGNSPTEEIASYNLRSARQDYLAFQASIKPQLNFFGNFPGLTRSFNGITQDDGSTIFRNQSQLFSNGGLSVIQAIPLTGGRISLFSGVSNFQSLDSTGFDLWQATPIAIRFNQPLFQVNNIKWTQKERKMRSELAEVEYLQDLENAAMEVTQVYFDALVAMATIRQAQTNVHNNDTIYTISKGRYGVGKIAENELLQSELSLMNAQAAVQNAQLDYDLAIRQLTTLLNINPNIELELQEPDTLPKFDPDPSYAVEQAMQYSLLVQSGKLQEMLAELAVKEAKADNGFQADINASFGLNQSGPTLSESYQKPINQQTFSVSLNIPIFQWGEGKARLHAAMAEQKSLQIGIQQQQKAFADDIYFRVLSLKQLRNQLDISARSEDIANRRYEITKNRYLIGKVSIQDLFIAQEEKDRAQQTHIANLRSYWAAMARLKADTLYDFEKMQPVRDR